MTQKSYSITGRVTLTDGNAIAGLTIDVHDRNLSHYQSLGSVLTRSDGEFVLNYNSETQTKLFEDCPYIYITVEDVEGNKLHVTSRRVRFGRSKKTRFEIRLNDESVITHRKNAQPLKLLQGNVLLSDVFTTIGIAWEQLARQRGDARIFTQSIMFCPGAPMLRFDDLIFDARDVLAGQPEAVERLHDKLMTMELHAAPNDEHRQRMQLLPEGDLEQEAYWKQMSADIQQLRRALPPGSPSIIENESFVGLVAAAIMLGGDDPVALHGNLAIIHDQFCGLGPVGTVFRAADKFRQGGPLGGFERAWQDWFDQWGPDDGPPAPFPRPEPSPSPTPRGWNNPWPPVPGGLPRNPEILEKWACTAEMVLAFRRIRGLGLLTGYSITSVSPPNACPGDEITITGSGFDAVAGEVRFRVSSGGTIDVAATSWTDTSITVRVPDTAICGRLSLVIYTTTIEACGRFIDLYKPAGSLVTFNGGATKITSFGFSRTIALDCSLPDSIVSINWSSCNADRVELSLIETDGSVIFSAASLPAIGSQTVTLPDYSEPTTVTAILRVGGPCGSDNERRTLTVQKPYALSVDGMEITQAIQFYNSAAHLTDPTDRGLDNSARLVSQKSAWLRVYLRSGQAPTFGGGQLGNVGGNLTVRQFSSGRWNVVGTIAAANAPVIAEASYSGYEVERNNINASLNFIIPATLMTGLLRLSVDVSSPDACIGGDASGSLEVDASLQQTLQIAAVRVGYNGPNAAGTGNVTFAPPTAAAVATEAGFSMIVYPLSNTPTIRTINTVNATRPLTGTVAAGGCDSNWGPILNQVANARTNDGNQPGWIYYGFVTNSIPITHGNVGCASGGNGAGMMGGGGTLAHEIGHQVGLPHAPCGAVGSRNSAYPLYEPYDTGVTSVDANGNTVWADASIGEYGMNINTGNIFNPNPGRTNTGKDLMSYCGAGWVSLFTHNFMINNTGFTPITLASGALSNAGATGASNSDNPNMRSLITLLGSVDTKRSVNVSGVSRLKGCPPTMSGERTAYAAQLLDADGEIASSAPIFTIPGHLGAGECGGCSSNESSSFDFISVLPDTCEGSVLRIVLGEETVWERKRPKLKTRLKSVKASASKAGKITVEWKYKSKPPQNADVWLRWSDDDWQTWHGLATGLSGTKAHLPAEDIDAPKLSIEVVVNDGYYSVCKRSNVIRLPQHKPKLAIIHPVDGDSFSALHPLHLWGAEIHPQETAGKTNKCIWQIDGKEVGQGLDIWIEGPKPGKHKIKLTRTGSEPVQIETEFS